MNVRATKPECIHAGASGSQGSVPVHQLACDIDRSVAPIDAWIRCRDVQRRWNLSVLKGEYDLDQPGDPRCCLRMPDVRLYRSESAEPLPLCVPAKRHREPFHFKRMAKSRTRPVRLDVRNRLGSDARFRPCLDQQLALGFWVRSGQSGFQRPVMIHG